MSKKYREEKRMREARQSKEALSLADDPLDRGFIDPEFYALSPPAEPAPEQKEVVKEEPAEPKEEKGLVGVSNYYAPYGGALSFDELDAYLETQEEIEHIESVTYQFRSIIENILSNGDVNFSEKALAIQTAAEVYKMRLSSREKEKSLLEKVKGLFNKEQDLPDSQMSVIQTKDGGYRWFGYFSNNYKDREGEIISAEAHKEFVAHLKANPDKMPAFWIWHTLGTAREKDADFIDYFDGFMVASGPLTEKEAERLEKAIAFDGGQTGMSHGMIVLQRDPGDPNVITKYRSYEISDLPLANAANGFTGVNLKEAKMSKSKFDRLAATIGEEAAKKVVDEIGDRKEVLEELGVESKEDEVAEEESIEEEESKEDSPEETPVDEESKEDESQVKELALEIAKELDLEALGTILAGQKEMIEELQSEIKELKKDDDEKISEQYEDKSLGAILWRKSQADETEITEEEAKEMDADIPADEGESSWVSDVFGS